MKHSGCANKTIYKKQTNTLPLYHKSQLSIRITCPWHVYPLEPHFYIAKQGYAGVCLFFLFLFQNIYFGYSLERGGSNVYPQCMFGVTILKISKCFNEIFKCLLLTKSLYTSWACFRNENASTVLTETTIEGS